MMSREDFREASRIQEELRLTPNLELLYERLRELLPVFHADEVILTLPDPDPCAPGAIRVWAHPRSAAGYEDNLGGAPGDALAHALRREGLRTARWRELSHRSREIVLQNGPMRRLLARTGTRHVLMTRLMRHDCVFAHLTFLKRPGSGDFGDEELHMLGALNPDLAEAARAALADPGADSAPDEVALVDSHGGFLFMTPKFPWLWAAISGGRPPRDRLDFPWIFREGSAFHRQLAAAVVSIGLAPGEAARARERYGVRVPYSRGVGHLMGLIMRVPGGGFGYAGSVVRIALRPDLPSAVEERELHEG